MASDFTHKLTTDGTLSIGIEGRGHMKKLTLDALLALGETAIRAVALRLRDERGGDYPSHKKMIVRGSKPHD